MSGSSSSDKSNGAAIKALTGRARQIVEARPAYREMVDFYLGVFQRQIEWRDRLVVRPESVEESQALDCLREGTPLIERFDPGLDSDSLLSLWAEMKTVFRDANEVLRDAVECIEKAERSGELSPADWLAEQRPGSTEQVAELGERIGVGEGPLASLVRAVTLPHWELVSKAWLPPLESLNVWRRPRCPTCGGLPALVARLTDASPDHNIKGATRRYMHCAFCASQWSVPEMQCPSCESTRKGDAKYYFTADEPDLRIEFCASCDYYVKVVDVGKSTDTVHVGLEALTTAHLDAMAQEKNLKPLGTSI